MSQVFTNEKVDGLSATGVEFFQAAAREQALSMELSGMHRRGQSAYSICKKVYGFTGTKARVLASMTRLTEGLIAEKTGTITEKERRFIAAAMENSHRG